MRPILIILIFFSGTVLSRYHEKTRFDRSVYNEDETGNLNKNVEEKKWSFTDYETNFVAYKDKAENNCYLERLTGDYYNNEENVKENLRRPRHSKVLYSSARTLTKVKAWKIAGGRVFDFCQGRNIFLLQDTKPLLEEMTDPFLNEIPQDENDIVTKTIVDVVLTPLISRAKRQIMLEEREKLNEDTIRVRSRRQVQQPRGRFRGQTQSQYLNIGSDNQKEGKAEAEATEQSSRALVSGSNGMGQAQSMSSGGNGCEGCPGYPGFPRGEDIPDRYTKFQPTGDTGTRIPTGHMLYPGVDTSGGVKVPPGRVHPGGIAPTSGRITETKPGGEAYPGTLPGPSRGEVGSYPGTIGTYPGTVSGVKEPGGATATGEGVRYPGSGLPGTVTGGITYPGGSPGSITAGSVVPGMPAGGPAPYIIDSGIPRWGMTYPGSDIPGTFTGAGGTYPGGILPGTVATGGGTTYPGGVAPGTVTTGGGVRYPGGVVPGTVPAGGGAMYPGGVVPGTIPGGGGAMYPGGVAPSITTTGGGATYPGGVAPGSVPRGGDAMYPGGVAPGTTTTGGGSTYPGSVPPGNVPTGGGAMYPGGVAPGTTTTGGGATYPGGVLPGTVPTGGGAMYPGGVAPGTTTTGGGATYPGGVLPGTVPTGGGAMYPGGVAPGTTTTGGGATYPGGVVPGTVPTGGGTMYPGGVAPGTTTTGGGATYPGGVIPGMITTGGGVPYPGGIPSGTVIRGNGAPYADGVRGTGTTGGGGLYPGAIIPSITGGTGIPGYPAGIVPGMDGTYPGNIISRGDGTYSTGTKEGGIGPARVVTGSTASADTAIYPGRYPPGIYYDGSKAYPQPGTSGPTGGKIAYPVLTPSGTVTGQVPGVTTTGTQDNVAYPGGGQPSQPGTNVPYPSGIVPGPIRADGTIYQPGTDTSGARQIYPGGIPSGPIIGEGHVVYPGTVSSGSGGGERHPVAGFPGSIKADTGSGAFVSYPKDTLPSAGQITYPAGSQRGSGGVQPGPGQLRIPYPGAVDGAGQGVYPGGSVMQYPTAGKYPPGDTRLTSVYPLQPGQYPGAATWQQGQIPGTTGGQTPTASADGQRIGQYPTAQQNVPGGNVFGPQYPDRTMTAGIKESSQYYQQPGGQVPMEDGSDSQASSIVKQIDSGTQASASAQGKFGQGTSQSHVTGTYSGSGSFSAQAGSIDANKGAQTEISGGKEGAKSSAQGIGGYGKSQTQVQLNSESGATSTGAQSSGWNHGTNTQVQASSKGGMADAQANGEGSTSSQAQIGFQPYLKTDEKVERQSRPFRGGGTASAQSGTHRGQSQSQLEGSFQYGITYTGAAQAGSGSGAAASRRPFNFNVTESELFKPFKPYDIPTTTNDSVNDATHTSKEPDFGRVQDEQGLQTSSTSRKIIVTNATRDSSDDSAIVKNQSVEKSSVDDTVYDVNGDYDEEYTDEDYDSTLTVSSRNSKVSTSHSKEYDNDKDHQSQITQISTGNQYDIRVNQDSNTARGGDMLQPGQSVEGYTIPPGFRGKVTSVAGSKTVARGDGKSQSQTVSLIPTESNVNRANKSPITETRSLQTNHERLTKQHIASDDKNQSNNFSGSRNQQTVADHSRRTNIPMKPSYYTITNSVAGKLDGSKNSAKKYEHRYYTKSSTCGYFTFSCNIVYGSNGRTKICKPKIPTYPDGTPIKC